jgi:uncharacterized delta-60 repeat protein
LTAGFAGPDLGVGVWMVLKRDASGELDPRFGGDGVADRPDDWRLVEAYGLALDTADRVLAVGEHDPGLGAPRAWAIVRYLPDGTPDQSFGDRGRQVVSFAGKDAAARAVAPDRDGGYVVAGNRGRGSDAEAVFMRFAADGSVDRSFGVDGTRSLGAGSGVSALASDSAGRFVATGFRSVPGGFESFVARLLANGEMDGSFGAAGFSTALAGRLVGLRDVAIAEGDRPVAAGVALEPRRAGVARLTDTGALDVRFGETGVALVPAGTWDESAFNALALDAFGHTVAVGLGSRERVGRPVVTRWTEQGELDSGFGRGGIVERPGFQYGTIDTVTHDQSGRIIGATSGGEFRREREVVFRLLGGPPDDSPPLFASRVGRLTDKRRELKIAIICSEDSTVVIKGLLRGSGPVRQVRLRRRTAVLDRGRWTTLRLRLRRAAPSGRLAARLEILARDTVGNQRTAKVTQAVQAPR